ncbi:histidine decarboxylase isoform X2 [Condylostylus longicornis]|uniref:histidine decarboxylase isoform X2 n=1 Tax=Condylostylus longicornis TaxID=2530218 RepID=UPI00244DDDE3|nr:histidine decarboxylase isoform X2 [Condylostylus longicornis]
MSQIYIFLGKEMVDYIADYLENIRDRRVFPDVKPGYMHNLLPESAPVDGEKWESIFNDIERIIMPGVTHWQSPHMHAYFPALNSFPSMLGDMLADAINCLGFTWASSPACTELETIVMNWLGKMIGLPDEFLHLNSSSKGGGVIQTTASEATLVCLLAGRTQAIKKFHEQTPGHQDAEINARLVAYCSDQAHSSVEKAALIGLVRMRYIESNEELLMRGAPLKEAIETDIKQGLIPFWVCCTLGTTGACAFDNLDEIGEVCREFGLWLHIDAAYAGSALICPEYRVWLKGIERANSIAFNPSKWLMVHFDCTAMWVKDSTAVHRTFNVEPLYLQHENSGLAIDYMHWQIPLSKRFRSLKLWFVLRYFGIRGLQKHIREGVRLAQKFEALVLADHRFEIPATRHLGMVVFRIKGENELTEKLLKRLNHRGRLHCVPASLKGKYVIRFTVTSTQTTIEDILEDWNEIRVVTSELLEEMNVKIDRIKVFLKDTKEKSEAFGSSLLLSNSPMSPKVVNGSFAAIFDADEFLAKTYAGVRIAHQDSPSMRRRVRGILMSGKQFSLDSGMDLVIQSCCDSNTEQIEANAIKEDSEDGLEEYELLENTPLTPPPRISPMINHHSLQQLKERKLMETKALLRNSAKSAIQFSKQPKPIKIEMQDPTQVGNKCKLLDNSSLSRSVAKSLRQEKTKANDFKGRIFNFNNRFEDKFLSYIKKNSSNMENTCSQCKVPLNLNNDDTCAKVNEKSQYKSNFKSTVNTVILKQKIFSSQHPKSKGKNILAKERYFHNEEPILSNEINSSFKQTENSSLKPQTYHGKKFLEQSSNNAIFAFYNIVPRSTNSYRHYSSISDMSEEELSLYDRNSVELSFDSHLFPSPTTQIFNNSKLLNKNQSSPLKIELKSDNNVNFKSNIDAHVKCNNNEDVVNHNHELKLNVETENQEDITGVLERSTSSLYLAAFLHTNNEKRSPVKQYNCNISTQENQNNKIVTGKKENEPKNNSSIENMVIPLKSLCEYNENEGKSQVESYENSNELKTNKKNQSYFHETKTDSSTSNSSTSVLSYAASLWSSLEVVELLSRSSSTVHLGADSWTVIKDLSEKENSENTEICKKCGHNTITTPSNQLFDVKPKQNDYCNEIKNIYKTNSIEYKNCKTNREDCHKQSVVSEHTFESCGVNYEESA